MIEKLTKGYERFRSGYFLDNRERFQQLADKQTPDIAMISCCDSRVDACEKVAVRHSISNLMTYPWIRERVDEGGLDLVGCYYDLRNGELIDLDEIKLGQVTESN